MGKLLLRAALGTPGQALRAFAIGDAGVAEAEVPGDLPRAGASRSVAEVIEHLVEIDRRRLFLDQACGSLSAYCIERLGYSEDEAGKRVRVTRLANRLPQVLEELRSGAIHFTGLFLLAHHLTQENYEAVMSEARGQSKRQIEQLIAARAPQPDVPQRLCQLPDEPFLASTAQTNGQAAAASCPGTGTPTAASGVAATPSSSVNAPSSHKRAGDACLHAALCKWDSPQQKYVARFSKLPEVAACQDLQSRLKAALELLVPRATTRRWAARASEPASRARAGEVRRPSLHLMT